ncbi:hypothetical protein B0I37DRAFT_304292 [Chaetomium sp. MPI-CAGE-AT-0009]|nr:hypothetical protein B0I37DRAFT_304292 [Chaetomium sp. MPI-CAGE-AT-0009]
MPFHSPPEPWTPPLDPDKPACPYQIGFQVEIRRHTPPRPYGNPHYGPRAWRKRSDTDVVMAYPPLEPENPLPSSSGPTATLAITGTLAVGDGRGAQLVICSIAPKASQPPFEAVAKIFDALYYSFESREVGHVPSNTAMQADVDYTHEAAALGHLCNMRQTGLTAPEYFGSWTFSLPITRTGKELERSVRLVLLENIKSPSIWSICRDPATLSRYSEQDRLEILARVLDGVVRQRHAGVDQRDLALRNVVLRPSPSSLSSSAGNKQPLPQPVLIDYNNALVFELTRYGKIPPQLRKLPDNPMKLFWNSNLAEFEGWTPSGWYNNPQQRQEWLKERFGGENASHYEPVSVELKPAATKGAPNNPTTATTASTRPKGALKEVAPPPELPPGWKTPQWAIDLLNGKE